MQLRQQFELSEAVQKIMFSNNIFIFSSEKGKKGVTDTNAQRLKNQVTRTDDIKINKNHNILKYRYIIKLILFLMENLFPAENSIL